MVQQEFKNSQGVTLFKAFEIQVIESFRVTSLAVLRLVVDRPSFCTVNKHTEKEENSARGQRAKQQSR
jgi:hypothetical protein